MCITPLPIRQVYQLYGDASENVFAGHPALLEYPINQSFTPSQQAAMAGGSFLSTLRETICARICIQTLLDLVPDVLPGSSPVVDGDSQASIHCLNGMKGTGEVFMRLGKSTAWLHIMMCTWSFGGTLELLELPRLFS